MHRSRRIYSLAAVAAAVAVSALAASAASAILIRLPNGQTVSYQPLLTAASGPTTQDAAFHNVDYNGGPVMPSNTDYLVFWSPAGYGAYGAAEYVSGIEQYWQDLAHDSGMATNVDSVAAQYNDATGAFASYNVTYGGAFLDTDPYPLSQCPVHKPVTNCLTDAQIQAEVERFAAANQLGGDLTHEFFVITPPHVEGCFTNVPYSYGGCSAGEVPATLAKYCAYHEQTLSSPMLFYADDPYVTGNSGCDDGNHPNGPSDGALVGGMSHEHNESITDPIPNDAWTDGAGTHHGQEIGDQCAGKMGTPLGTAPNGASYNQVINGHFYWYQEEWSNDGATCLQRLTPPATLASATFTATPVKGLTMNFDATGSTAPGGAFRFSWQFNAVAKASTVETTTPKVSKQFPTAGAYSIGLTVYGHHGQSAGAGGIITTGKSGFTPGFTFSPSLPTAGQPVAFSGLTNVSRARVTEYLWEFGDGTTGTGANPTHTYAAPGSYKVEVVLFSGVGSAYPGSGASPIYAQTITVN